MSGPADEAALWARVHQLSLIPKWAGIERERTVQRERLIINQLRAIAALHRDEEGHHGRRHP